MTRNTLKKNRFKSLNDAVEFGYTFKTPVTVVRIRNYYHVRRVLPRNERVTK